MCQAVQLGPVFCGFQVPRDKAVPVCSTLYLLQWPARPCSAHVLTALHCTAPHCSALHCPALHCTALQNTALHCTTLHYTALHCTALHCTALHCTTGLNWTELHCIALQCNAIEGFTSHFTGQYYLKPLCGAALHFIRCHTSAFHRYSRELPTLSCVIKCQY